jgi:uncharacterized protein (TIGR02646 family)
VIRVRRKRAVPPALAAQTAEAERKAAKILFRRKVNWTTSFSFGAYRDRSVRDALEAMFSNKCAYCETKIGAADESEIEHWRPKGVVKEKDGTRSYPGYYWLATEWDNLLLSCLKCNRPRTYRVQGGEEDEETWERSGKGMLFPLAEGDVRAKWPRQQAGEHPLLLNPCKDRPEDYLEFVVLDNELKRQATVKPKALRGRRQQVASESIDVYSLNRPLLVTRRREFLLNLQRQLAELRQATDVYDQLPPGPARDGQDQLIRSQVEGILDHLKSDSEYLLMARQAIGAFLKQEPGLRRRLAAAVRR